jgi:Bacterial low temperature requirement A protein (LtrA)
MRIAVSRAPGAERVVTPLELSFDLVYVFAIGQLSHHLLEHVDLRTGAETVSMALAVPCLAETANAARSRARRAMSSARCRGPTGK